MSETHNRRVSLQHTIVFSLIVLLSCSGPPPSESSAQFRSAPAQDTIPEEESSDASTSYATFALSADAGDATVMGVPLSDFLQKAAYPDELVTEETPGDELDYRITYTHVIEGSYTDKNGSCNSGAAVLALKSNVAGEEEYILYLVSRTDGEIIIQAQKTYYGNYAQSSGSVSVSEEYELGHGCKSFALEYSSEGGDIDLSRESAISFFIVGESGFYEALNLVTENTHVGDYEATGDDSKNATSQLRTFEVQPETSAGLRNIKTRYILLTDGEVTVEEEEVYMFDGEKYSVQL